jgi:serine protease Do
VKKLILIILIGFILFIAAGNVVKNYADNKLTEICSYAIKANVIVEGMGFDTGYFGRDFWVGSGVIVDSNGLIVTAGHCLQDAEVIRITFNDGSTYLIKDYYIDPCDDIGVLRVPAKTLNYVELGNIVDIYNGLKVFNVGNARGIFDNTVVDGEVIKSVFRRSILDWDSLFIFANIDIKPGCSGGGLYSFDNYSLIGIASMSDGQSDSFFVPIYEIKEAIENSNI